MVLMNAGKNARRQASIYNNTKIYGDMGGLISSVGKEAGVTANRASSRTLASMGITTEAQMKAKGLLSKNPAGSGGVGKKVLMYYTR